LVAAINDWRAISHRLAEPPRKRVSQRDQAHAILS